MVLRNMMSVLLPLVLAACSGAAQSEREMAPHTPNESQPASAPAAETAPPAPTPKETAAAPAPAPAAASAPAPAEPWFELADSPGAPELAAGAEAVAKEEWQKARFKLDRAVAALRGKANLDATLAGQALLGRTCAQLEDDKCAGKAFSAIVAAWKDPAAARAALDALGGDEDARKQRLQRALLAVGEARFFLAEQKRAALERMRMPTLPSNKTEFSREEVQQHIQTKVAAWREQKLAAVEELAQEYRSIADLAPSAPPRWAVDGSARVSQLWGRFLAEFRAAPIPSAWKGKSHEDLRRFYYEEIDEASDPIRARVLTALKQCTADAARFRHEDEFTRGCAKMLEKFSPER